MPREAPAASTKKRSAPCCRALAISKDEYSIWSRQSKAKKPNPAASATAVSGAVSAAAAGPPAPGTPRRAEGPGTPPPPPPPGPPPPNTSLEGLVPEHSLARNE